MPDADVIVVGAGLSGLAAAKRLEGAGRAVIVLDAADDVGGRVRSDRVDGWTLDRGFQVIDTGYPEPHRILTAAQWSALDLKALPNGARVRAGGSWHRVGDPRHHRGDFVPTVRSPLGSIRDKLALAAYLTRLWLTPGDRLLKRPERSAYQAFRAAGLSDIVIDRLLRPFLSGVLLEDELTTSSHFVELVLHAFSRGRQTLPSAGAGALATTLAAEVADVRLQTPVAGVSATGVTTAGGPLSAAAVIVATDPVTVHELVPSMPAAPMRPVSTLYFAADTSPTDGDGYLCIGPGPLTNAVALSDTLPSYAPSGRTLVSASTLELGLGESDVRAALTDWFGGQVAGWELLQRYDIPAALPAADPPLLGLRRPVRVEPGLYVCGDHRDSPSQQGALVSGRRAADALLADQNARG